MDNSESASPTPIYEFLTPEKEVKTEDGVRHGGWFVALDPEPNDTPISEYQLVLSPAASGDRLTLFYCTHSLVLPPDAAMIARQAPNTLLNGDYEYKMLYGQLVSESQIDAVGPEYYYISLPPEMCGRTVPQQDCPNDDLWELASSTMFADISSSSTEDQEGGAFSHLKGHIRSWLN